MQAQAEVALRRRRERLLVWKAGAAAAVHVAAITEAAGALQMAAKAKSDRKCHNKKNPKKHIWDWVARRTRRRRGCTPPLLRFRPPPAARPPPKTYFHRAGTVWTHTNTLCPCAAPDIAPSDPTLAIRLWAELAHVFFTRNDNMSGVSVERRET